MFMKHCIIDFETFGTNTQNCVVIDCSVMVFDSDRFLQKPYTIKSISECKKFKLSVTNQVEKYQYKIEEDTLAFWQKQGKEVRAKIKPLPTDITVQEFVEEFLEYLTPFGKIDRWWSRSNSFDPIILWRLFDAVGHGNKINEYLPHWNLRDTRTFIDAKLDYPRKNGFVPIADETLWNSVFIHHDSSWDILADVLRMQAITRAENDMEQI
jgi:hypothetical protein